MPSLTLKVILRFGILVFFFQSHFALAAASEDFTSNNDEPVSSADRAFEGLIQKKQPAPEILGQTTPGESDQEAMIRLIRECTRNVTAEAYAAFDLTMSGCVRLNGGSYCQDYSAEEKSKLAAYSGLCCETFKAPGRCTELAKARVPASSWDTPTAGPPSDDDRDEDFGNQMKPKSGGGAPGGARGGGGDPGTPPAEDPVAKAEKAQKEEIAKQATPQGEAAAEQTAQQDLESCRAGRNRAVTCCGDPRQCGNVSVNTDSSSSKGLSECQKQKRLAKASSEMNNGLAAICSSSHRTCQSTCGSLITKYEALISKCNGCESQNIYTNTLSSLKSSSSTCSGLRERSDLLAAQGLEGAKVAGSSAACEDDTAEGGGAAPSSLADMLKEDKGDDEKDEVDKMKDCMNNPNSPECQQASLLSGEPGQAGFSNSSRQKGLDDFNVDDMPPQNDGYIPSTSSGTNEASTVNTVPNNSGGGIPGGAAAAGGGAAPRRAGAAPASYSTDVFTGGFQAGGYSAPAGQNGSNPGDAGSGGRNPASNGRLGTGTKGFFVGMDLKSFLPGAKNDPNRMRLGAHAVGGGASKEITSKFTDNWNKMSVKFKERCILELKDCDLQP